MGSVRLRTSTEQNLFKQTDKRYAAKIVSHWTDDAATVYPG